MQRHPGGVLRDRRRLLPSGVANPANACQECIPASNPTGWSNDDTNLCGAGSFCSGSNACQAGVCESGTPPCTDDGLACTTTCDEASRACNVIQPGFCLIDNACYPSGTANPANPCQECLPASSQSDWSDDDANTCSDGLFCTGADHCAGGACLGGASPCQDDGQSCTTTCDEASSSCNVIQAGACLIDGSCVLEGATPVTNTCLECIGALSQIAWSPDDSNACSDGLFCTGPEHCAAGACESGVPACTDDGLTCTDTCAEATATCNILKPDACLIQGVCYPARIPTRGPLPGLPARRRPERLVGQHGRACDDGNACTAPDACQAGACTGAPLASCCAGSADCADGKDCTDNLCNAAAGTCTNPLQAGFLPHRRGLPGGWRTTR